VREFLDPGCPDPHGLTEHPHAIDPASAGEAGGCPQSWQDHDDDLRGGGLDHARLEALLSESYSQRRTRAL
jgi:hypothetical protein